MNWEVILHESVETWLLDLTKANDPTADKIEEAIDVLAASGPGLGRPLVDTISNSRLHNLKELRPGSRGRTEIRMLFVFDPDRAAVFLVAGDKVGRWSQWYDEAIPLAEKRYAEYRAEIDRKAR